MPRRAKPDAKALKMASQLLDAMASDWKPSRYHDTYTEELKGRIDARDKGKKIVEEEPPEPTGGKVVDLMAALEESVAKAKGGGRRRAKPRAKRSA
jgi:DNA end-binding protein Ku